VVLPRECREGPFCVTGQVNDQSASPVAGVTASVIGPRGEGYQATTDARGFFFLDRLPASPPQIRFSRPGFASQVLPLPAKRSGEVNPIYVTLRRLAESDCTCDPNAFISGRDPCPDDRCH
jgi:hypothetical protein